jgi:CheY-like chemotaxis protein
MDADRITQVITNLLSNAAKFSPSGSVVYLRLKEVGGGIRLSVKDQGSGIPNEFRTRIFQKFAQADSSDTRKKGGTGLGLSICKVIIEKHHGLIDFTSKRGAGSEFYFDLPISPAPLEASPTVREHPRKLPRVLHVEDDQDLARVIAVTLELEFDIVHVATLAEAQKALAQTVYNLILLDLQLPDGDGATLLADVPVLNGATPIVIFSARETTQLNLPNVGAQLVKSRTSNEELQLTMQRLVAPDRVVNLVKESA